jgi:hypothetical protein
MGWEFLREVRENAAGLDIARNRAAAQAGLGYGESYAALHPPSMETNARLRSSRYSIAVGVT